MAISIEIKKKPKKHILRTLYGSVRQYKKATFITPLFMIGETAAECMIPYVIGRLINLLQGQSPTGILEMLINAIMGTDTVNTDSFIPLIILAATLLILAFFSFTCGYFGAKFSAVASTGFAANLREDIFKKIQTFSFANIDKFSTSSLVTRMTTDVNNVQMSYQMIFRTAIRVPLMIIFSVAMAFTVSSTLSWIFVALLPLLAIILGIVTVRSFKIFNKLFVKYDDLNASVQENVKGIRVVKSFVREDYEIEKFDTASTNLAKEFTHAERIVAWMMPAMNTVIHVSNILIGSIGALAVVYTLLGDYRFGVLYVGDMSSLITYGIQLLASLMMLAMIMVMVVMSIASANRIYEVLVEEPTIHDPENPIYEIKDGSIEFSNVNFKYSTSAEKFALNDVNLKIESGQTIGIIGSTGSSKTTLISLISRLYDTTTGEVKVGGINVKEYDLKVLRDNVAVVLQKNVLFSGTILENLRWGNENATEDEVIHACQIAQADDFIRSFPDRYQTHIEQGGTNVSGGQKQRLCIARALLKNPKIIIFDDSTSAVDTKTDATIRHALATELPDLTKIIISQRVASVENADKIIVMDNGYINAVGTSEELLKSNAIYKEIYEIQNRIGGK